MAGRPNGHDGAALTAAIVGNGRSGTNWLLTMVDASPLTHCRSEPHDIATSLIHELPRPGGVDFDERLAPAWSDFVTATRTTIGERDHTPPVGKAFYHGWVNRLGLAGLHRRPRVNRLRQRVLGSRYRAERPLSPVLGSARELREAPCVMKLNDFHAAHLAGVRAIDPTLRVVHIVRHPGGYLDSALRRHFGRLSATHLEQERTLYRRFLEEGRDSGVYPADVLDDMGDDAVATVMRFWSANNHASAVVGEPDPAYLRVVYEQMAADPLAVARQVFEHLDLPFDDAVAARINARRGENVWGDLSGSSSDTARRWEGRLAEEHLALVERELERTPMRGWWG